MLTFALEFSKGKRPNLKFRFPNGRRRVARYGSGFQILDGFEWDSWCTHKFPTFAQSVPD